MKWETDYGRQLRLGKAMSGNRQFLWGGLSVGCDKVSNLDCDNWDNGVYIIDGWDIVGREYFKGTEQNGYDLLTLMQDINESMPKNERLPDDALKKALELTN